MADESAGASYLALLPWDIDRWQNSSAFRRMPIGAQGAYRNLCDSAWKQQPSCELPDDDRELWRLANVRSLDEWRLVKADVFNCDAWRQTAGGSWLNEVVLETFQESDRRHTAAVRSGRIAGKASARARRALSQTKKNQQLRTTVERPLNDRATTVNPPSPSPSPSPSESTTTDEQRTIPAEAGRPRARRSAKPSADRPETRALCDRQALVMARPASYSATALEAFARLLDAGRTPAEVERVLVAFRDRASPAATFARDGQDGRRGGPGLAWALRPGESGGFDKILMQLDDGSSAPRSSPYDGAAARIRARMEVVGGKG